MAIGIVLVLIGIVGIGTVVGFLVLRKYDEDDFIEDDDDEIEEIEKNKNVIENKNVEESINKEDINIEKPNHKVSKTDTENDLQIEKQSTDFNIKKDIKPAISDDTIILSDFYNNIIAFLVQLNGIKRGTNYELKPGESHIGRSDENDIVLEDMYVSGNHALIKQKEDKMYIYDLNSKNGVFVNGNKIEDAQELNNNDTIIIGETKLRFVVIK